VIDNTIPITQQNKLFPVLLPPLERFNLSKTKLILIRINHTIKQSPKSWL